jgi:hypothetical protein
MPCPKTSGKSRGIDVTDNVLGVASDTTQQRRAQGVEEGKPHETETRTRLDDSPIVNGNAVMSP